MLTQWRCGLGYSEIRKRRKAEIASLVRGIVASEHAVELESYPGYYVTPDGKVYSTRTGFICLRPGKKPGGYRFVGLRNNDGVHYEMVHRLVAKTFICNPRNLPEVNHKNGNKDDNDVSNLEWCTRQQNAQHAVDAGLRSIVGPGAGKLTKDQIEAVKAHPESCKRTGRKFGVSAQTVCNIRRGYVTQKKRRSSEAAA